MTWHPTAERILGRSTGALDTSYPPRGVLHSTEGNSIDGAVAAYQAAGDVWPHFTIEPGRLAQHVPIGEGARALYHGTVATNTITAVQIEIVGYAADSPNWSHPYLDQIAALMRWCETTAGIPRVSTVDWVAYPASYGTAAPQRLTDAAWLDYTGWCAHEHVPSGNDHGDAGAIDIGYLLGASDPQPAPDPTSEDETMPVFLESFDIAVGELVCLCEFGGDTEFFGAGHGLFFNGYNPDPTKPGTLQINCKKRGGGETGPALTPTVPPLDRVTLNLNVQANGAAAFEVRNTGTVPLTISLRGA